MTNDKLLLNYASTVAIPEPQTWALWVAGLLLLIFLQARRRKR